MTLKHHLFDLHLKLQFFFAIFVIIMLPQKYVEREDVSKDGK